MKKNHLKLNAIIKESERLSATKNCPRYQKLKEVMDYCYQSLSYEYQRLIKKCYFTKDFKFWWNDEYCKSSFYRKIKKAENAYMRLFLLKYYEEFDGIAN